VVGLCITSDLTATTKISMSAGLQLCVALAMIVVYLVGLGGTACRNSKKVRLVVHVLCYCTLGQRAYDSFMPPLLCFQCACSKRSLRSSAVVPREMGSLSPPQAREATRHDASRDTAPADNPGRLSISTTSTDSQAPAAEGMQIRRGCPRHGHAPLLPHLSKGLGASWGSHSLPPPPTHCLLYVRADTPTSNREQLESQPVSALDTGTRASDPSAEQAQPEGWNLSPRRASDGDLWSVRALSGTTALTAGGTQAMTQSRVLTGPAPTSSLPPDQKHVLATYAVGSVRKDVVAQAARVPVPRRAKLVTAAVNFGLTAYATLTVAALKMLHCVWVPGTPLEERRLFVRASVVCNYSGWQVPYILLVAILVAIPAVLPFAGVHRTVVVMAVPSDSPARYLLWGPPPKGGWRRVGTLFLNWQCVCASVALCALFALLWLMRCCA
jgi:hypothetical protein